MSNYGLVKLTMTKKWILTGPGIGHPQFYQVIHLVVRLAPIVESF